MTADTVVLRLVGAATLVGHKAQPGEARLTSCAGGYGPLTATVEDAADTLLRNRPVRIPAHWEGGVRRVIALRALRGDGPDGNGVNWNQTSDLDLTQ